MFPIKRALAATLALIALCLTLVWWRQGSHAFLLQLRNASAAIGVVMLISAISQRYAKRSLRTSVLLVLGRGSILLLTWFHTVGTSAWRPDMVCWTLVVLLCRCPTPSLTSPAGKLFFSSLDAPRIPSVHGARTSQRHPGWITRDWCRRSDWLRQACF
jgi:hypothetical protein